MGPTVQNLLQIGQFLPLLRCIIGKTKVRGKFMVFRLFTHSPDFGKPSKKIPPNLPFSKGGEKPAC